MTGITILIYVFVAAVTAGVASTLVARGIAWRLGITNAPNPLVAQHRHSIAYLGGVAVAAAAVVVSIPCNMIFGLYEQLEQGKAVLLAVPACGFLLLGLVDDLRPFSPAGKFMWQVFISAYTAGSGVYATVTGIPAVDMILSLIWIVTLVNAFNVTDVCDGLVAGLGVISLLFVAILEPSLQMMFVVIAGACVGFLFLNAPPASIFLGDAGSHFLGFLVAAGVLLVFGNSAPALPVYSAPLLAAVPLFELVFVSVMRMQQGKPCWKGSTDHFALRMQVSGMSRWQTDMLAWTAGAVMGVIALSMHGYGTSGRMIMLAVTLLICITCWRFLASLRTAVTSPAKNVLVNE